MTKIEISNKGIKKLNIPWNDIKIGDMFMFVNGNSVEGPLVKIREEISVGYIEKGSNCVNLATKLLGWITDYNCDMLRAIDNVKIETDWVRD
jgi:hypothetical protein